MVRRTSGLLWLPIAASLILLTACDEQEQGRILRYEKGTYLGQPDQQLDQKTLDQLRQRARLQQGS